MIASGLMQELYQEPDSFLIRRLPPIDADYSIGLPDKKPQTLVEYIELYIEYIDLYLDKFSG